MTYKIKKTCKQILPALIIAALLSIAILQINGVADCQTQTDQWKMDLKIFKNGEPIKNNSTLAPFDQVELVANVTYRNAGQPNVLVTFNVEGLASGANKTTITRIEPTNDTGQSKFSFRLPISAQTGNWQATASIKTTSGVIKQTLNIITQWNLEIASINLADFQGQTKTSFNQSESVTVNLKINNRGQTQTANISLYMHNSNQSLLNQTSILNKKFESSANATGADCTIQIPASATAGTSTINVVITSGSYANTPIPVAENKSTTFTIVSNSSQLEPTPTPSSSPTDTPTPTPQPFEITISLFSWLLIATGFFTFSSLMLFLRRKSTLKLDLPFSKRPAITLNQEHETQKILANLNRISSTAKRIQELQAELKSEQELHRKDLEELNRTIDNQEQEIKNYFGAVREEIRKAENGRTDEESTGNRGDGNKKDN